MRITTFQSDMKTLMESVAKLEYEAAKGELKKYFTTAMVAVTRGFMVSTDGLPEKTDNACYYLLRHAFRFTQLQTAFEYTDAAAFDKELTGHLSVPSQASRESLRTLKEKTKDHGNALAYLLIAIFCDSVTAYEKAVRNQEIKAEMEAIQQSLMSEKPTADTAMALEDEPTLDARTMNALIEQKVAEATKQLRNQVQQLATKSKSKNGKGGASTGTPSSKTGRSKRNNSKKNKNSNKGSTDSSKSSKKQSKNNNKGSSKTPAKSTQKKTTTKNRNQGRKADGAANDSKNDNNKRQRNGGLSQSGKKKNNNKRNSKGSGRK
jgi:hypothetical protein